MHKCYMHLNADILPAPSLPPPPTHTHTQWMKTDLVKKAFFPR